MTYLFCYLLGLATLPVCALLYYAWQEWQARRLWKKMAPKRERFPEYLDR